MQTQHHTRNKSFHPSLAAAKPAKPTKHYAAQTKPVKHLAAPAKPVGALQPQIRAQVRPQPASFRVLKPRAGFQLNDVVYEFNGPTHGVDVPGEINVTVVPGVMPFVGLEPEYLERIG